MRQPTVQTANSINTLLYTHRCTQFIKTGFPASLITGFIHSPKKYGQLNLRIFYNNLVGHQIMVHLSLADKLMSHPLHRLSTLWKVTLDVWVIQSSLSGFSFCVHVDHSTLCDHQPANLNWLCIKHTGDGLPGRLLHNNSVFVPVYTATVRSELSSLLQGAVWRLGLGFRLKLELGLD